MARVLLFVACMKNSGKELLLSIELSRARALLAGGASAAVIPAMLREWALRAPMRGSRRATASVLRWCEQLRLAITDALPLGAPVGSLLRAVQPMVRREERHFTRLQGIERQFAFQGGIAIVLPWAVAAIGGEVSFNALTVAGAAVQAVGLVLFYTVIRRAMRPPAGEQSWVFELLVATWMRAHAGMGLRPALGAAVRALPRERYSAPWERWLEAFDSGALHSTDYEWGTDMPASSEAARILRVMLQSGTPAAETLADLIAQVDDERQAELEERIGALPTRLSLVFCALLAPAVFLVFMGGLWPVIQEISM